MEWFDVQCAGTYHVWFCPPNKEDVAGQVCDVALDKTYAKILEVSELWKTRYARSMTTDELQAMWAEEPVVSNFKPRLQGHGWFYDHRIVEKFREFKYEISDIYREELGRAPTHEEIDYTFGGCWNKLREYQKFEYRDEMEDSFEHKVQIDSCLVCGEPVYADPHFLEYAGEISMNFGYGSLRDCDYGKGYIHDICSAVLGQELFKYKMKWNNYLGDHPSDHVYDIEKSKESGKLVYQEQEPKTHDENSSLDDILGDLYEDQQIDHNRNDNETP